MAVTAEFSHTAGHFSNQLGMLKTVAEKAFTKAVRVAAHNAMNPDGSR